MSTLTEFVVDALVVVFIAAIAAGVGHRNDTSCKARHDHRTHSASHK